MLLTIQTQQHTPNYVGGLGVNNDNDETCTDRSHLKADPTGSQRRGNFMAISGKPI